MAKAGDSIRAEAVEAGTLDEAIANRGGLSHVALTAAIPGETAIGLDAFVAAGEHPGPVLWVQACLHGDEPHAALLARSIVAAIDRKRLRGTVLAVPVGNPPAFRKRQRVSPMDGADVNRIFPGGGQGKSAALAAFLWNEVGGRADALIDIHASNLDIHGIEHVLVVEGKDPAAQTAWQMAEATRSRYLCPSDGGWLAGTLFNEFTASGRPGILFDRGNIFDAAELRRQTRNMLDVMVCLRMLDRKGAAAKERSQVTGRVAWLKMPCEGELVRHCDLGSTFEAGEELAEIRDLGGKRLGAIVAPHSGVVVARSLFGYMHAGEGVFLA